MKELGRVSLCLAVVLFLAAVVSVLANKPVQATNPQLVTVTNTPLPVQGSVSVGNTPNVNIANSPSVNVANIASTQTTAASLVTHVGQVPSDLVMLKFQTGSGFWRVLPDGLIDFSFNVPAGKALIITDVEWKTAFQTANQSSEFDLSVMPACLCAQTSMIQAFALADSNGQASGNQHLTTGVVVTDISRLSTTANSATLQGYLVPNP